MDPAIVAFGFGIGILVGMTGMGGASLMTPLLILIFGIQPVTAIGTDIFYAAVTKTFGGVQHLAPKHRPQGPRVLDGGRQRPVGDRRGLRDRDTSRGPSARTSSTASSSGCSARPCSSSASRPLLRTIFFPDVIKERYAIHL